MKGTEKMSEIKTVGIIAALEVEVNLIKNSLLNKTTVKCAGTEIHTGKIGNTNVVLMQCGIGKVSAALGTQAMISQFKPDCIINTGCAGGIAKGIKIGDIVLSTATAEWDMDTTVLGDPRGYIYSLGTSIVKSSDEIVSLTEKFVPSGVTVFKGLVASGDQFVSSDDQRKIILGSFPDALCAEMEGAAVGHVCAQNNVPFCVIRCMSDTADGDSKIDYAEFSKKAGESSAEILINMINSL